MDCCTCTLTPIVDYRARAIDIGISEEALDLNLSMARANGKQEANVNAGYHCDPLELSLLHPVWKETNWDEVEVRPPPKVGEKRVAFGEKVSKKVGWDSTDPVKVYEEDTDFVERGDRAMCKVEKIVVSVIGSSSRTIIPILVGVKDANILQEMNFVLSDIVSTLAAGEVYLFCNSSSIRIKPGFHSLNLISRAYVVFQYFAGFPPEKLNPHILSNAAEVARNQPGGVPQLQKVDKPTLQRTAPRSIYCTRTGE